MSIQTIAHKGWPEHTQGTRDACVIYIRKSKKENWDLGKEFALEQLDIHTPN